MSGFTLAEALLASIVLAIVAAACTLPLVAAAQRSQEADRLKYAVELGQAMMDEIVARPVFDARVNNTDPGPSPIETSRKAYVTVDAFDGYSESDRVLRDYEGAAMAGGALQGFWRAINTQYVTYPGQAAGDTSAFVLVTVNVYHESRLLTTFARLTAVEQ